jgi:uncharacterized protein YbjT (DUF2867 family)
MAPDADQLFCDDLPTTPRPDTGTVLVTGATGYVGGRLVPELLARGYQVRVMVRAASPEHRERWPDAEIVVADATDEAALWRALEGINTAYYLIHSMLLGAKEFALADICAAMNFAKVAEGRNLERIIYLGGLGDVQAPMSPHLQSRMAVALELQRGLVPTTILRAAVIVGSGSASYEIAKHLVDRVPVHLLPRWARTNCQPIGIRDVIKYLVGVLEMPETAGESYDIGGPDRLTYEKMLRILADLLGRRRLFVRTPISSTRLYAYAAGLLTPVPAPIVRSLLEGGRTPVVCQESEITRVVPFRPITYREALVGAMSREEQDNVHTRWSDAYPPAHELSIKLHELGERPRYRTSRSVLTSKGPQSLFRSVCRIGGAEGWAQGTWMWRLRGALDRVLMGVGTIRGRRSLSTLRVGDVIDFWRVEDLVFGKMLLLRAEMKLPGRAWLEFGITPDGDSNRLSVNAYYQPRGPLGKAYWYAFMPFHHFIFTNLIRQIEARS